MLRYAIADVGWFVDDGDPVDVEAWQRGTTQYLPDRKAGLYPPVLSEGAASLLPTARGPQSSSRCGWRPTARCGWTAAERAIIRSRAKLAYDSVRSADLPPEFAELARRIQDAEARRGAARVDPPAQEVDAIGDGRFELQFRPPLESEVRNAAMSLAATWRSPTLLQAHRTGLFRVMAEPDERAVAAPSPDRGGLGLAVPASASAGRVRANAGSGRTEAGRVHARDPARRQGACYVPYREGVTPWHAAVAATYAHATAPLRRLADRYVVARRAGDRQRRGGAGRRRRKRSRSCRP